jgi:hypothetical protein
MSEFKDNYSAAHAALYSTGTQRPARRDPFCKYFDDEPTSDANIAVFVPQSAKDAAASAPEPEIVYVPHKSVGKPRRLVVYGEPPPKPLPREVAIEFLKELLAAGPVPRKQVYLKAREAGITARTLRRAGAHLKVEVVRKRALRLWKITQPIG